ncbi:MAG: MBL fold metallo-hydrolase [Candidatus Saccharibacteria bacterium]|nr:MBL fold metallo-hydrolase [Pseudorhodobacter sp.]
MVKDLSTHHIISLHVLDFGTFDVGPGRRTIGIPGFLLQTDQGARILVDTGFPPAYATDPDAAARDSLGSFGKLVDFTDQNTATGQLAVLGLSPDDIDLLILTHSHIDHVGSLPLFTCPVLLTATERAEPRPLYFGSARPMDWPDLPYQTISAETRICHGLTVIPTPGHTPGHLSLLVTEPRPFVIAADAINRASEPDEGFADASDPVTAAQSAARLMDLVRDHSATLIWGHEPTQWPLLPKAPKALT